MLIIQLLLLFFSILEVNECFSAEIFCCKTGLIISLVFLGQNPHTSSKIHNCCEILEILWKISEIVLYVKSLICSLVVFAWLVDSCLSQSCNLDCQVLHLLFDIINFRLCSEKMLQLFFTLYVIWYYRSMTMKLRL